MWCLPGQVDQESGGHSIELAYVAESEGPQKRPQCGWGVDPVEKSAHTSVAEYIHVIDGISTGDHARD